MFLNKNGTPYYTQSDKRWTTDIMTSPLYQRYTKGKTKGELDPDTIGEFFCFDTMFLNIANDFYKNNMTPKVLNQKMIQNNGYLLLKALKDCAGSYEKLKNWKDSRGKSVIGRESFTDLDVLMDILNINIVVRDYTGEIDLALPNIYYGIKVPFQETGHYSNIVKCPTHEKSSIEYFDVYDDKIKKPTKILEIIKVVF